MRSIEDMNFYVERQTSGTFVGRVREFTDLRTRPKKSRLGFDRFGRAGQRYTTFENAVAAYVYEQQRECPMCLKGAVVDTDWGWKCEACGSCDVAVGCTPPDVERIRA